jgi:hypothetical protein
MKMFILTFIALCIAYQISADIPDWSAGSIQSSIELCTPDNQVFIQGSAGALYPPGFNVRYQWLGSTSFNAQGQPMSWFIVPGAVYPTLSKDFVNETTVYIRRAILRDCKMQIDTLYSNSCLITIHSLPMVTIHAPQERTSAMVILPSLLQILLRDFNSYGLIVQPDHPFMFRVPAVIMYRLQIPMGVQLYPIQSR